MKTLKEQYTDDQGRVDRFALGNLLRHLLASAHEVVIDGAPVSSQDLWEMMATAAGYCDGGQVHVLNISDGSITQVHEAGTDGQDPDYISFRDFESDVFISITNETNDMVVQIGMNSVPNVTIPINRSLFGRIVQASREAWGF